MPAPTDSFSGRRFRLIKTLGEGTFGVVYLAELLSQGGFRKQVALKLLNQNWDPEADAGRRLRDEARLLGRLNHRHIVRVDDLVRIEGRWGLMMEYIEGADLDAVIEVAKEQKLKLPVRTVVEVGIAIAEALHAAKNAPGDDGKALNVVHRDIKPSNVLLSEAGDIKVLDFGVARAEFSGREAKTERVRYGSLGYMSPERVLGGEETAAGDVYALGVVLYEMLLLSPFGRAELTADAHQKKNDFARAYLIGTLEDAGTPSVEASAMAGLIERCLQFEDSSRPTSLEIATGLEELMRSMPGTDVTPFAREFVPLVRERLGPGTLSTPSREVREDVSDSNPVATVGVTPPAEPPTRLPLFLLAGFLGLFIAIGGGWWLLSEPSNTPPANTLAPLTTPPNAPPANTPAQVAAPPNAPPANTSAPVEVPPSNPTPSTPAPVVTPPNASNNTPPNVSNNTPSRTPPVTPPPEQTVVPPVEATPPVDDAPVLRAVKFNLEGATGLKVRCGAVSQSSDTSVLFRDLKAGTCVVSSGSLSTTVSVTEPRGFTCTSDGEKLACH